MLTTNGTYKRLTLHQRISLKGMIASPKEREVLNHKTREQLDKELDALRAYWLLSDNFVESVELFFRNVKIVSNPTPM